MVRWSAVVVAAVAGCSSRESTAVGATLDDGQVLVGGITTATLRLEGAFGAVDMPLDDVGMLVPVEGLTLGDSHGHVTVWLRNGSELKGRWAEPELAMAIRVGGRDQAVEVPTERMQTLQLQAGEAWPSFELFRVRTSWGDDFLVDPQATRITVANKLGDFEVTLAECLSVGPVGAPTGDWRVVLQSGTVLIGPAREAELSFVLPMGPETIVVPLTALTSLERGGWADESLEVQGLVSHRRAPAASVAFAMDQGGEAMPEEGEAEAAQPEAVQPPRVLAKPGLSESAGWFDNTRMQNAKH